LKRFILLAGLLGLMAAHVSYAEEPSMCKSMCASEKQQCTGRADRRTELDNLTVEDKNPLARMANQGQVQSMPARAAEQSDFLKRKRERLDACDASYMRCTRGCGASDAVMSEKAAAAK